jgi:pyridoxal phosphate enzyme (YggS family)
VIRARITAAGGDPDRIDVVAVTKGHGLDAVRAALAVGLTDIGENYAPELVEKAAAIEPFLHGGPAPRWHFLGTVQRNKVPRLAPIVSCWQAVARAVEATAIGRHSERPQVFVEIDLSGQPGRGGCPPAEAERVVEAARLAGCTVRGLMTVAPLVAAAEQPAAAARAFATVAQLAETLGLGELSMGMSHDLEQAVVAGTTMVRIGTALFGERSAGSSPQAPLWAATIDSPEEGSDGIVHE